MDIDIDIQSHSPQVFGAEVRQAARKGEQTKSCTSNGGQSGWGWVLAYACGPLVLALGRQTESAAFLQKITKNGTNDKRYTALALCRRICRFAIYSVIIDLEREQLSKEEIGGLVWGCCRIPMG